jgi:hypothetical protein
MEIDGASGYYSLVGPAINTSGSASESLPRCKQRESNRDVPVKTAAELIGPILSSSELGGTQLT